MKNITLEKYYQRELELQSRLHDAEKTNDNDALKNIRKEYWKTVNGELDLIGKTVRYIYKDYKDMRKRNEDYIEIYTAHCAGGIAEIVEDLKALKIREFTVADDGSSLEEIYKFQECGCKIKEIKHFMRKHFSGEEDTYVAVMWIPF